MWKLDIQNTRTMWPIARRLFQGGWGEEDDEATENASCTWALSGTSGGASARSSSSSMFKSSVTVYTSHVLAHAGVGGALGNPSGMPARTDAPAPDSSGMPARADALPLSLPESLLLASPITGRGFVCVRASCPRRSVPTPCSRHRMEAALGPSWSPARAVADSRFSAPDLQKVCVRSLLWHGTPELQNVCVRSLLWHALATAARVVATPAVGQLGPW